MLNTYNILIADEEHGFRDCLREYLRNQIPNCKVYLAESSSEALSILEKYKMDLLFLDVAISKSAVVEIFRELKDKGYMPMIFVASNSERSKEFQQPIEFGVTGYIHKANFIHAQQQNKTIDKDMDPQEPQIPIKNGTMMLSTATGICPTPAASIIAIEKTQRNVLTVYTHDRILKEVRGTLLGLESISRNFIYLNRQCIVDRMAITRVMTKTREAFIKSANTEVGFVCSRQKIRELFAWLNGHAD